MLARCGGRHGAAGRGPAPASTSRPRSSSAWSAAIRSAAISFSAATSSSLWAEPRCSICRDPRREDHTTWTAVAPELVRAVRTHATSARYAQRLVRKSSPIRPLQTSKHGNPLTAQDQLAEVSRRALPASRIVVSEDSEAGLRLAQGLAGVQAGGVRRGRPRNDLGASCSQVSMVAEGCHGNRGVVPRAGLVSPSVRLRVCSALPATDALLAGARGKERGSWR